MSQCKEKSCVWPAVEGKYVAFRLCANHLKSLAISASKQLGCRAKKFSRNSVLDCKVKGCNAQAVKYAQKLKSGKKYLAGNECIIHRRIRIAKTAHRWRSKHWVYETARHKRERLTAAAKISAIWRAKVTPEIAAEIRQSTLLLRELADQYGISTSLVSLIRNGKRWALPT